MSDTERLINRADDAPPKPYDTYVAPVLAEGFGTMLFVFIGVLSTFPGNVVEAGFGHGLTIALLIMGMGEISGGHFNPAVTFGVIIAGGINPLLGFCYIPAQLIGGIIGAALVRGVLPKQIYDLINGGTHQLGPNIEGIDNVEPGWGVLIEMMLTTVLVFTVLMAAVNPKTKSALAPLAIGFAVAVDILAAGQLTGASMNPARAFGPAVCASGDHVKHAWEYHYIYWLGPAAGAIFAGIVYRFFFASPNTRWIARSQNV